MNSRGLQVHDLNLHLNFQERMITADSLLRYHRLRLSLDPRRRGARPASRISGFRVA